MNVQLIRGGVLGAAGCLALVAGTAMAQERPREERPRDERPREGRTIEKEGRTTERTTTERRTETTHRSVNRITTILKSEIYLKGGSSVGRIVDFVVNDHGCIDYLVAQDQEELFLIPFSAATVQFEDRRVEVNVTQQQFKTVTRFTSDRWPDLQDSAYQQQLFRFWGVRSTRPSGSTFEERSSAKPIQPGARPRENDDDPGRPDGPTSRDPLSPRPRDPNRPRDPSESNPAPRPERPGVTPGEPNERPSRPAPGATTPRPNPIPPVTPPGGTGRSTDKPSPRPSGSP